MSQAGATIGAPDGSIDLVTFEKGTWSNQVVHDYLARFEGEDGVRFVGKRAV
jgi:hypothetical protein